MAETAVEKSKLEEKQVEVDPCEGENWHPGKAWMACIAATVFVLLGSMTLTMLSPVLKMILQEFGLSNNYGSTLTSIHTLASALITIPLGWLMSKYGFRKLGYVAYVFMFLTVVWGAYFVNDAVSLVIIRILQAVGYAIPPIVGVYMVTQWFPKNKQSLPIGIISSATSLATIFSQQLAKIALSMGSWRMQFFCFGVVAIIGFILFIFFMKPGPGFAKVEAERQAKLDKKKNQEKAPMLQVLSDPRIWAVLVVGIAFTITQRSFSTFSNIIFVETCGVTAATSTDLNTLFNMTKMASGVIFGFILSRCTKHGGLIVAILLTIHFIGRGIFFSLDSEMAAWIWCAVIGIVGGSASFCQMAIPLFSSSPAYIASALVVYNVLGKYASGVVAPYIVSGIQEATGSWSACMIPMLIIGIIGGIGAIYCGSLIDKDRRAKAAAAAA